MSGMNSTLEPTEITQINSAFIEENKNLVKPMQKSSAPYNKKDRFARRQEVYRLHFELGYTAIKVSELMKINRNTINNDVKYWYSKLAKEWKVYDIHGWIIKQINRLESQRSRLLEELGKHEDLESRILIEKLILEIDEKLSKTLLSVSKTIESINEISINKINDWMEKNGMEHRFLGY